MSRNIDRAVGAIAQSTDMDMIGAASMAGVNNVLGSALVRALASLDSADIKRVGRVLNDRLPPSPGLRLRERELVLAAVVRHFLSPACSNCKGRGYHVIPQTTRLGDVPCKECEGSGQTVLVLPGAMGELIKKAQAAMDAALGRYDRGVSRKLGKDQGVRSDGRST